VGLKLEAGLVGLAGSDGMHFIMHVAEHCSCNTSLLCMQYVANTITESEECGYVFGKSLKPDWVRTPQWCWTSTAGWQVGWHQHPVPTCSKSAAQKWFTQRGY
jgi:hypothetical protein